MKKIVISPRVNFALSSLDPDGIQRVHAWFDYLQRWDEDELVRKNSLPLGTIPGVYMLKTTTELRVFFRIDGDTVTVLDVASQSTILASGGLLVSGSSPALASPPATVN